MSEKVKFTHSGKPYEIENNYKMLPNKNTYAKEVRDKMFTTKMKKKISAYNRSKAQRKKYELKRILNDIENRKLFGIPFTRESWEKHGIMFDEEMMKEYGIKFDDEK